MPFARGPRPVSKPRLRVAVLASGSGSNLQAILDASAAGRIPVEVVAVLANVPDAYALERAKKSGVPAVLIPSKGVDRDVHERVLVAELDKAAPDVVALAGYMRILSSTFVKRYAGRLVNIHPALLPAFPGLHAQRQAFDYGVKVAGCTTHFVDEGTDTGPIILQEAVPVLEGDTAESLQERILEAEHRIYPETLGLIAEGRVRLDGRRVCIDPPPGA